MKLSAIRLCLVLGSSLFLTLGLLWLVAKEPAAAYSPPQAGEARPKANFHLWQINEIFSCADGSIQFVEMVTSFDGQEVLNGHELRATSGLQSRSFIFPNNSATPTGGKSLLIATAGFGSLPGGINPDFTLTSSLIFTNGAAGSVSLIGANTLSYAAGQLPLDGINSLGQGGLTAVNSPKNFAGQTGSVSCPLVINKKGPATVNSGSRITYTLTVSSTQSNTGVVLTDTVPLSTTFAAASGGISPINGVLTWTLNNLPASGPGSVVSRTLVVTANAGAGAIINNASYGVRSNQSSARGMKVPVLVINPTTSQQFIYLPTILKNATFGDEHAADLPSE